MWVYEVPFPDSSAEFISRLKDRCEAIGDFELFPQGGDRYNMHLTQKGSDQKARLRPTILGLPVVRIVQWPIVKVTVAEHFATFRITPDDLTKWFHLVLISLFCFGLAAFLFLVPALQHQDMTIPFFAGCIFLAGGIANLVQYYYWVRDGDGFHVLDNSLTTLLSELRGGTQPPAEAAPQGGKP